MSEKKSLIEVPLIKDIVIEDLRLLKPHVGNPNRMTVKQKELLWHSLVRFGWLVPIIADKDGVIADGEQRVSVCLAHGEFFGPVLRRPLNEFDRLYIGQDLNKLRGKHEHSADEVEYCRMIGLGGREELKDLLNGVGERLPEELGGPKEGIGMIPESREIIIRGHKDKKFDEQAQKTHWEKLTFDGYDAGLLNL